MNSIDLLGLCGVTNYYECNREERNLAAIVYYLLLLKTRREMSLFLYQLGVKGDGWEIPDEEPAEPDGHAIYFEYAYLRDCWNNISRLGGRRDKHSKLLVDIEQNEIRRKVIQTAITETVWLELGLDDKKTTAEFNAVFSSARGIHSRIHSPASWTRFPNERIELVKWAFNAKPDLVIHTSPRHAVCFEFKLESGLSRHGTGDTQLDVQREVFRILGIESKIICVCKTPRGRSGEYEERSWRELFQMLGTDFSSLPRYVRAAVSSSGAIDAD